MYEMIWDVWNEAACWLEMNIYILTYLYLDRGQLWGSYAISKQSIYKYLSINKLNYNNIVSYLPLERVKYHIFICWNLVHKESPTTFCLGKMNLVI